MDLKETTNLTKEHQVKYNKLLNNLLDIKGKDPAIYTKITTTRWIYDVFSKFGLKETERMLFQKQFTIKLKEQDLQYLLQILNAPRNANEVVQAFQKCKEKLFKVDKEGLNNPQTFDQTVQKLFEKIETKKQKAHTRWNQFKRKVIDANTISNIWPLYVATCFVSIRTKDREIYAPFLLKAVEITKVDGATIEIKSIDDWIINEKLVFLLNKQGYGISESIETKDQDTEKCLLKIASQLNETISTEQLIESFQNKERRQITNQKIDFHPGVVLGLFQPAGGHLRKTMLSIIENDEVDEILEVEPNKKTYIDKLMNFMQNRSKELLRIQPSNFSQDKALASSLIQNTIIWGPPGTGKSQVIANIIANVLYRDKSAIVMSQKKAALDVLKNRLGEIAPFALFILNDNKMKKSEFYKPLQKFINKIDAYGTTYNSPRSKLAIIDQKQTWALNTLKNLKQNKQYNIVLEIISIFQKNEELLKLFFDLNPHYKYPKLDYDPLLTPNKNMKIYKQKLARVNKIKQQGWGLFKWYPSNFKKCAEKAFQILNTKKIQLDKITKHLTKISYQDLENIMNINSKLKPFLRFESDEKFLANALVKKIMDKVDYWKLENKANQDPLSRKTSLLNSYKKFTSAVRAGRALPYKFVKKHKEIINNLFPVIITTPETSFINWQKNFFDYAILDESSQMFLEIGLPIIYLAKTKILAGDQQQMKPSRWFVTRDEENDKDDIPEDADSLLDYALEKGTYKIMLNKNYRSSRASLMSFSAKNFYNSELEVIDQNIKYNSPAIEVVNVKGIWKEGVNFEEIKKIVTLTTKLLKEYKKIILLTFNAKQRQFLEKTIIDNHPRLFEAMEKEQLLVRNIENIQGDEADLVIASLVYDKTTQMGATYVTAPGGKYALNVAISRAKEKMIVVKSVAAHEIRQAYSDNFIVFKKWLEFLDLKTIDRQIYSQELKQKVSNLEIDTNKDDVESQFETEVLTVLQRSFKAFDLKILTQFPVGSKRIDLVFVDKVKNNFVLGIEVDSYKYHQGQGYDEYLEDFSRQAFLEQKGYTIFRIQEIEWTINRKQVVNKIKNLLKQKGFSPIKKTLN